MCDFGLHIPVEAIEEDLGRVPRCGQCDAVLKDEGVFDGVGKYYCDSCAMILSSRLMAVAKVYAAERCRMSEAQLPTFNPCDEWKPTREEYASGAQEVNTENAFRVCLRHKHTNYDDLIRNLSKEVLEDQVYYSAIRDRIDELVDERIDADGLIRPEDEWESDSDE